MSSIKIRSLPEKIDNLDDNDLLVIEDNEDTKKISLVRLRSAFSMDGILTSMKNMLIEKIDSFILTHNTRYKELLSRNEDLEVICHNLQNDHDHDAQRIFELEDTLVIQENTINDLQLEKNKLNKIIAELQNDKDILSEKIILLNSEVSKNDTSIIILKSQVKDLQTKCQEARNINEVLQQKLNKLQEDSSKTIDETFNDINEKLSESINDLMAYIRYYHSDVDDIEI